jgi:hypothetical protein
MSNTSQTNGCIECQYAQEAAALRDTILDRDAIRRSLHSPGKPWRPTTASGVTSQSNP